MPESSLQEYFSQVDSNMQTQLEEDRLRQQWKSHALYAHNKQTLEGMCRKGRIPVTSNNMAKYHLVKLLSESQGEEPPLPEILHSGNMASIPKSSTALNQLSVGKLQAVLHYHGVHPSGTKDELVLAVYLLVHGKKNAIFAKQKHQVLALIQIAEELILHQ